MDLRVTAIGEYNVVGDIYLIHFPFERRILAYVAVT